MREDERRTEMKEKTKTKQVSKNETKETRNRKIEKR